MSWLEGFPVLRLSRLSAARLSSGSCNSSRIVVLIIYDDTSIIYDEMRKRKI